MPKQPPLVPCPLPSLSDNWGHPGLQLAPFFPVTISVSADNSPPSTTPAALPEHLTHPARPAEAGPIPPTRVAGWWVEEELLTIEERGGRVGWRGWSMCLLGVGVGERSPFCLRCAVSIPDMSRHQLRRMRSSQLSPFSIQQSSTSAKTIQCPESADATLSLRQNKKRQATRSRTVVIKNYRFKNKILVP